MRTVSLRPSTRFSQSRGGFDRLVLPFPVHICGTRCPESDATHRRKKAESAKTGPVQGDSGHTAGGGVASRRRGTICRLRLLAYKKDDGLECGANSSRVRGRVTSVVND